MDETVDTNQMGNALDDAELAPEQPETGDSLSTLNEEAPADQTQQEAPPAKEPGWIKGRIDKAVTKALREQEERLRAEYDAKLAPVFESMLERQAHELVDDGEFKSLERAKEYVRMKQGMPAAAEPAPTAQQKAGATDDAEARARSKVLAAQAEKIKSNRGVDVMQAFNSDPNIQQKILSGEWDFYDVAEAMGGNRRQPPSPVRSPNGIGVKTYDIMNMSEEQFKRLQANLSGGRKYDMRK